MEIPFCGELSKNLLKEAIKLDNNPPNKIFGMVFIKCFAITVALLIVFSGEETVRFYAFLIISIFLVEIIYLTKWKHDCTSKMFEGLPQKSSGIISEQEIVFTGDRKKSQLGWPIFSKHKISSNIVLLYYKTDGYCVFGKSWFQNDNDWNNFTSIVISKTSQLRK